MNGHTLIARVREAGYRPVIRMTKYGADNLETCMNDPQMGRIVHAEEHHDGVYIIDVDLNEFESYNDSVADRNFYDRHTQPVLTAKEAGCYPANGIERVYLMLDDEIEPYFTFAEDAEKPFLLNIRKVTVVTRELGTDIITVWTTLPPGCPGLDPTDASLTMDAAKGTGVQYVRDNFGIEPEVIESDAPSRREDFVHA